MRKITLNISVTTATLSPQSFKCNSLHLYEIFVENMRCNSTNIKLNLFNYLFFN